MKHIVMWKLKDENRDENCIKIKEWLEGLKDKVNVIKSIEVGINAEKSDAGYDVVLISEFNSKKELDEYQVNPLHMEAAAFIKSVAVSRAAVDFE